jgi:6-phosphogluconolactonase
MNKNNHNIINWQIFNDAEAVAQEACQRILKCSQQAIEQTGAFKIVLAGGRTPEQTYRLLKQQDGNWQHWHIYYGDERCLPENDSERNSVMASRAWLDYVPIPKKQIHPMPTDISAAPSYTNIIKDVLPFDMVLLGMGEDGHTASLFPRQQYPENELVHAIYNAPKPPPKRISLSVSALSKTQELLVLVTGAGKQEAVAAWRRGEHLPIAQIKPAAGATVLIDRAAWENG